MSDKEILEKAIALAIESGWDVPTGCRMTGYHSFSEYIDFTSEHQKEYSESVYAVIFNHDFAKALWGTEWKLGQYNSLPFEEDDTVLGLYKGGGYEGYGDFIEFSGNPWQFYLQQMVIADDPIKYLGEHLDVQKQD